MKRFYDLLYGRFRAPWDIGPRAELVALVESGRLQPCRVLDLGSGTASNCIFLAQHGFRVTGVDFSKAAVALGRQRAAAAGVNVEFIEDDLTDSKRVRGPFDLLVDYGTLDDLSTAQRGAYVRNVSPLVQPGGRFLLYAFEWKARWWERVLLAVLGGAMGGGMMLTPGEVEQRFADAFEIERLSYHVDWGQYPPGEAVYLLTRRP